MEGACSIRDLGYATLANVLFGSSTACTLTLNAPTQCDIENMSGELTLAGMDGGVCTISMSRGSLLTINNTCTAGAITITGAGLVTDNSGGGCTVTSQIAPANVTQWLGTACATPRTAGIPEVASGPKTDYFVDGTNGADGNDGLTWATAKDDIGDVLGSSRRIWVSPGTYSEAVYMATYSDVELILLPGAIVTQTDATVLTMGTRCRVTGGGTISRPGTVQNYAIYAWDEPFVRIDNINIDTGSSGIRLRDAKHALIENVLINSAEYGILQHGTHVVIRNVTINNTGWSTCSSEGIRVTGGHVLIQNATIYAESSYSGVDPHKASGIAVAGTSKATVLIDNVTIETVATNDPDAVGITCEAATDLVLVGKAVISTTAAQNAYDLYQTNGILAVGSGCQYSTSTGTITQLNDDSVARELNTAIPGSPTADSINQVLKDWIDGGRLDLLLDAVTGARSLATETTLIESE
jgi:hypothetical protein